MATKSATQPRLGWEYSQMFVSIAVVNMVVIWVAHMIAPQSIVLGTAHIPAIAGLVLSGGILSWVCTMVTPAFYLWEARRAQLLAPQHWLAGYFLINAVALWLIARGAEILGLGISSWVVVLVLAAVIDFAQGMVMMGMSSAPKK